MYNVVDNNITLSTSSGLGPAEAEASDKVKFYMHAAVLYMFINNSKIKKKFEIL